MRRQLSAQCTWSRTRRCPRSILPGPDQFLAGPATSRGRACTGSRLPQPPLHHQPVSRRVLPTIDKSTRSNPRPPPTVHTGRREKNRSGPNVKHQVRPKRQESAGPHNLSVACAAESGSMGSRSAADGGARTRSSCGGRFGRWTGTTTLRAALAGRARSRPGRAAYVPDWFAAACVATDQEITHSTR